MTRSRRSDFPYQPYYCEENVWHLAKSEVFAARDGRAVFVSNETRHVALWRQRASRDPEQPILWDYHVLFLVRAEAWLVYDHDTTLDFPVALDAYLDETFRFRAPPYGPRFAVYDAPAYVAELATDRSHMVDDHGAWRAPPPPWPPIGSGTNLERYIRAAEQGLPIDRLVTDGLDPSR
jgi:hypothetical protein